MAKNAIVLLNMGGPNNLFEVETFLSNMFNDPNILTMKSSLLRRFIASVITTNRTRSAQDMYDEIGGKSPIVELTKELVQTVKKSVGDDVVIDFAMRYTPPFATEVVERLREQKVTHVYLIPLYPQYSTTTTKSSLEDFEAAINSAQLDVVVQEVRRFYTNDLYNSAVVDRIKEALNGADEREFELVFSAHGLPQSIIKAGDPYQREIREHVRLLDKKLSDIGLNFKSVHLAYQSKVGPMKWLEPSLQSKLSELFSKKVLICPMAFTIDNSETVYELSIEYKEIADELGFLEYRVAKCVNSHPDFVKALIQMYRSMK